MILKSSPWHIFGYTLKRMTIFALFAIEPVFSAAYTNLYSGSSIISLAISNFTKKTFLGSSRTYNKLYASSINSAAQYFDNDYQIYYQDIRKGITDRHRALGFMDIMVCTMTDPVTNLWRMYGDGDNRNDTDLRAVDGDNTIWDMIDTNYKPSYRTLTTANVSGPGSSPTLWLTGTNPSLNNTVTTGNSYYARGGEYVVARFSVPSVPSGAYSLFLGRQVIRPGTFGQESAQKAGSYQILLYTPTITNTLIPVIYIQTPSIDGVWEYTYDYVSRIRLPSVKHIRVPRGTPITFSADRSFNATGSEVISFEWDADGSGNFVSHGSKMTTSYHNNGNYFVKLRLTTASGIQAVNDGLSMDSNFTSQSPSLAPVALPFLVEVVDSPQSNWMGRPRPSPFIAGLSSEMWIDFNLSEETPVTLSIFTLNGHLVKNLVSDRNYPSGFWGHPWDGRDTKKNFVGEGIYYAILTTKSGIDLKKIHVVRY